jgi:hypothetical protein
VLPERNRYPLLIFGYPLFIFGTGVAVHSRYGVVMRFALRLTPWLLLCVLAGSTRRMDVEPIKPHAITIKAERLIAPTIETAPGLRYVDGWSLSSPDDDFGGLSSLIIEDGEFVALSDIGAVIRFGIDAKGEISGASLNPLPRGCATDKDKRDRDSESIARDPASGTYWIGFEWRNVICRSDPRLRKADRLAQPKAMQRWSKTGGPEAMVRLSDGRFLIFAESASGSDTLPDLIIADRDPTTPDAHYTKALYRAPEHHFSPTDAAQLPDGRLLVINRRFEPPAYFSARLSLLDPIPAQARGIISGKTIAKFGRPGLTSNFEGVAVSNEGGRTFIWIISDDNYMWIEHTYLLKFELLPEPKP